MTNNIIFLIAISFAVSIFGVSANGIAIGMALIISLLTLIKAKYKLFEASGHLVKAKEFQLFIGMILIFIISAILGVDSMMSLKKITEICCIGLGGYLIYQSLNIQNNYQDIVERFFKIAAISAALFSLVAIVITLFDIDQIVIRNLYSSSLVLCVPFAIYFCLFDIGRYKKFGWCMALFLIITALFVLGGRTAWVALLFTMILFPILSILGRIAFPKLRLISVLCAVILGAFSGLEIYKSKIESNLFVERVENIITTDRFASGRMLIWEEAIEKIKLQPWLGYGVDTTHKLGIKAGADFSVHHVHNIVLEIILETGILGFLCFCAFIGVITLKFFRTFLADTSSQSKAQGLILFLSFVAYGVCSMSLTSFFHAWWMLYMVVILMMLKLWQTSLSK